MDTPATFFRYALPAQGMIDEVRLLGDTGSPGGMRNNSQGLAKLQKLDRQMRAGLKIESHFRRLANHSGATNSSIGRGLDFNTLRRAGDSMFARAETSFARQLPNIVPGGQDMLRPARFPGVQTVAARQAATFSANVERATTAAVPAGLGLRLSSMIGSAAEAVGISTVAGTVLAVVAALAAVAAIGYGIYKLVKYINEDSVSTGDVPQEGDGTSVPAEPSPVKPADVLTYGGDYFQPTRSVFRDPTVIPRLTRHFPKTFPFQ